MQKDAIHYGGWEHRDVHNIGGMIYVRTTLVPSSFRAEEEADLLSSNVLNCVAQLDGARTD